MADNDQWRAKLTPEQYRILREKGTDTPFTGALLHNNANGDYLCAACQNVVFKSNTKFDSGSGWPSFYDAANRHAVKLKEDNSNGLRRIEVQCSRCGSHLGHVFNDAPNQPTGKRFCINSTALQFKQQS